jgi:hypothetical protein
VSLLRCAAQAYLSDARYPRWQDRSAARMQVRRAYLGRSNANPVGRVFIYMTNALAPRTQLGHPRSGSPMTMLNDVADVETVRHVTDRSPDTRAAIAYLIASGATAISIEVT